jgi:hypothetical protein
MKYLFLIIAFCFCNATSAQTRKIFKILPGEKAGHVIPKTEIFSYPEFKPGSVLFKSGNYADALLNYNALYGDMQFIDHKGDTLGINNENTIKMIVVEKDTFYYDKYYLKLIAVHDKLLLAERQFFSFVNRQKKGGFGELSSASIETYNTTSYAGFSKDIVAHEIITMGKYRTLYIGDKYNHFLPVNKKNLQEIYAKREKEIAVYLKENNVNFFNEEDVQKLINYFKDEN